MFTPETAKTVIKDEFEIFSKEFTKSFDNDTELLKSVNSYILQRKGKQIRPVLTMLAAKSINNTVELSTIKAGIAVEMLHTASLIHDDVVDDADSRRGQSTVNAVWKNRISILVGDYLLSKALITATETENFDIVKSISNVGKELSEGELHEIGIAYKADLQEDTYFEIIRKKTGVLFSTACRVGAQSINASVDKLNAIVEFGDIFGLCFQIKDDIFDFVSTSEKIGKPVGCDIKEGKMTLPLLYALNQADETTRNELISLINDEGMSEEDVKKLINFAVENGGIEYSNKKLEELKQKAIEVLDILEDSDAKNALIGLLDFTIKREK